MPDTPDLASVLGAAEAAAEAGDYTTAEARLREAADLQESALGPAHPDLANTLNNLAIVCERTGKAVDAEQFYRRAHEIATVSLAPDHPFVTTSRDNLREFCEARGLPVDPPKPAPAVAPPPAVNPSPARSPSKRQMGATPVPRSTDTGARDKPVSRASSRPLVATIVVVGALVVLIILAIRLWPAGSTGSPQAEATPAPVEAAPARPEPAPPEPAEVGPVVEAPAAETVELPSTAARRIPAATNEATPTVAEAEVCMSLSTQGATWECEPADASAAPGRRVFYTRIRTDRDTTVEHRWYQGSRLRQAVELRILTNLGAGYRTYSQFTMDAEDTGDWRVELRSSDGALLHEERFVVR